MRPHVVTAALVWALCGAVVVLGCAMLSSTGCAIFGAQERAEVAGTLNSVEQCQEKGRAAPDGGHLKAYDACMREAGLRGDP